MMTAEQVRAVLETLSPTQEKVDLAVKKAVETAQPSRVIIFGSWARGEAKWNSDVDLAIVMPNSAGTQLAEIRRLLRARLSEVPMTIDLVLATEEHLAQFRNSVNSIYYNILKDGKVAYEHHTSGASSDPSHQGR
jgi:predicted nucleotidyltransferase